MRKKVLALLLCSILAGSIAVLLCSFTGCFSYPHQSWLEDRSLDKIAEDRVSEIVTALENKDQAAIRSMFSKQALNEAGELDEAILSAIEYYTGNFVSSDGTIATDESQNGKRKTFQIRADYTILTDLETYNLFFIEKYDSEDAQENGLYLIWISKDSEKDKYEADYGAGIHFPS